MEGEEEIVLLDYWCSPYVLRVKIALEEKGISNYVCKEQDLVNKSSLLVEMNPINKTVPVLIHNGKPLSESLLILQYIDEVWDHSSSSLLPLDPYQRSQARFWGDFIDKKIVSTSFGTSSSLYLIRHHIGNDYDISDPLKRVSKFQYVSKIFAVGRQLLKGKGDEEQEILVKEYMDNLNILLEGQLKNQNFFGGDTFGYIDVALIPTVCWSYTFEKLGNFNIEANCPKIVAWAKRCNERYSVSSVLPDPERIYSYVLELKKMNRI